MINLSGGEVKVIGNQGDEHTFRLNDSEEQLLINSAGEYECDFISYRCASSQVITHFLKMASTREKLEQERLHRENLLLSAKVDQIASAKRIEELYEKALNAMRMYAGRTIEMYDED